VLPAPILATKLDIPRTRPNLVLRPRLIKHLGEGLGSGGSPGVTLISVTAGFGKTIGVTDRSLQKAKCRTMNDESYEVFAPHWSFRGDKV